MTEEKTGEKVQDTAGSKQKGAPLFVFAFIALVVLVAVTLLLSRAGFVTMKP